MTIMQIEDHSARALDRLITEYKGKPRLSGIVSAVGAQMQELEDVLFAMRTNRSFAEAAGAQLDGIGRIIGLARVPGDNDAIYRVKLVGQIAQNTGFGRPEDVIAVVKILTGAGSVRLDELYPAAVALTIDVDVPPEIAARTREIAQKLLPAGVSLVAFVSANAENDVFSFSGGTDGAGFGDFVDADVGGVWASLIGTTEEEEEEDEMAAKHVTVSFVDEMGPIDVDTLTLGMNAQKCSVRPLDFGDDFRELGLDVSAPNTSTIRLKSAVNITKDVRVIIIEAKDP